MKLFIWEGVGVLSDYTNGMIVALAPDLETAIKAIEEKCGYADNEYPHQPSRVIDLQESYTKKAEAWLIWGGG